jgi:hypothetical protein
LECSQSENDLAKIGYILEMKVGEKQNPFMLFGYVLELIIKIWRFGIYFSFKI